MGMTHSPEKCFITEFSTENRPSSIDAIEYIVDCYGVRKFFVFHNNHKNSPFVEKYKYILHGLIINNRFPFSQDSFYDNKILEQIIKEADIPKTPKSKLDNLLNFLFSLQDYEGSQIKIYEKINHDTFLVKLYFINQKEYMFYLSTLKDMELITFDIATNQFGTDGINIKFTYKGLEYIIGLQEEGSKSKNCFVAMSFSESMHVTRQMIKQIIDNCGYIPVLIDEINYGSDITINDAIISNIKSCKFLIADFTNHKHGVYFEAGYALGKNKPVIYLCFQDDFKNSHFDTNHYPHIVYKDLHDLQEKLTLKIQAYID